MTKRWVSHRFLLSNRNDDLPFTVSFHLTLAIHVVWGFGFKVIINQFLGSFLMVPVLCDGLQVMSLTCFEGSWVYT